MPVYQGWLFRLRACAAFLTITERRILPDLLAVKERRLLKKHLVRLKGVARPL